MHSRVNQFGGDGNMYTQNDCRQRISPSKVCVTIRFVSACYLRVESRRTPQQDMWSQRHRFRYPESSTVWDLQVGTVRYEQMTSFSLVIIPG